MCVDNIRYKKNLKININEKDHFDIGTNYFTRTVY